MSDTNSLGWTSTHTVVPHLYLSLLVSPQLKVLASLQRNLLPLVALSALHPQNNLLCGLSLGSSGEGGGGGGGGGTEREKGVMTYHKA